MKNRIVTVLVTAGAVLALTSGCSPSGPEELLRGDELLRTGHAVEAQKAFERAVELLPKEARAWNRLGMAYQALDRLADARRAYQHSISLDRNLSEAQYNLGVVDLDDGNPADAERALKTFLAFDPNHVSGLQHLGLAQYQLRQWDAAEKTLNLALRLDPSNSDALNTLGLVQIARRQFRDAYRTFATAQKQRPGHAASLLNLAVTAHQHLGDRRAAYQHYREYLALQPPPPHSQEVQAAVTSLEKQLGIAVKNPTPQPVPPPVVQRVPATTNPPANPQKTIATIATNRIPPASAAATNLVRTPPVAPPATLPAPPAATRPSSGNPPGNSVSTASSTIAPSQPKPSEKPPAITSPAATLPPEKASIKPNPVEAPPIAAVAAVKPPDQPRIQVETPPAPPAPKPAVTQVVVLEQEIPLRKAVDAPTPVPVDTQPSATTVEDPQTSDYITTVGGISQPGEIADASAQEARKRSGWKKLNPAGWFRKNTDPADPVAKPLEAAQKEVGPMAKLNPARWFGKDGRTPSPTQPVPMSQPEATPLRSPVTPLPEPAITASEPVTTVTERFVVSQPRTVASPRYKRQWEGAFPTGNRVAADALFQEGVKAHDRRDTAQALQLFRKAVDADPSYFEAHYNLAAVALDAGDVPQALKSAEAATQLRPGSQESRLNFASALHRARHLDDAVEQLEQVLARNPANNRVRLEAGNLYARELARPADARAHYEALLSREPNHPQSAAIRKWLATPQ